MDYTKLLEVQKKLKPIIKDATNPFFKSKYADINSVLAEVRPILSECGVIVTQPIVSLDNKDVLMTHIINAETGESMIQSSIRIPDIQDVQKLGAAITYLRRYALVAALSLEQEDDDGNTASAPKPSNTKTVQTKTPTELDPTLSDHHAYIIKNLPPCNGCGKGRRYIQAGTTKDGKRYEGFYPCTSSKDEQTPACRKDSIKESIAEDIVRNNQEFNNL